MWERRDVETAVLTRILKRAFLSEYLVLSLSVVYFAVMAATVPDFASPGNAREILSNMLPLSVVALGQTIVLITGGIDLSLTGIIAVSSVLGARVMTSDGGWLAGSAIAVPAAIGIMLAAGGAVGLVNGASVACLRLPPFIVTLTTMMFFGGFAVWFTKSASIYNLPEVFLGIGGRLWTSFIVVAALAGVIHLLLTHSLYGRWLYAAGGNAETARVSGVPVQGVIVGAYVVCGICAAIASVLYTGRLETGSPTMGDKILLDVIGATVIGGTSLFGGIGKVIWTVFGVLFLALIDNSLLLMNISAFAIMAIKGGIILAAALMDTWRRRAIK